MLSSPNLPPKKHQKNPRKNSKYLRFLSIPPFQPYNHENIVIFEEIPRVRPKENKLCCYYCLCKFELNVLRVFGCKGFEFITRYSSKYSVFLKNTSVRALSLMKLLFSGNKPWNCTTSFYFLRIIKGAKNNVKIYLSPSVV